MLRIQVVCMVYVQICTSTYYSLPNKLKQMVKPKAKENPQDTDDIFNIFVGGQTKRAMNTKIEQNNESHWAKL